MKIEVYIQARMGSTRLPGKVLSPVMNRPLLSYLIERLHACRECDAYRVLTGTSPQDDPIVTFCKEMNIPYFRGSDDDVLARYQQASEQYSPDAIVRVTGDCPLIDPNIVDEVIRSYREGFPKWDYVSNVLERTFPRGMDVEVFSRQTLESTANHALKPSEREHVTTYIYAHPELFKLHNVASKIKLPNYRLTVDTIEDFRIVRHILEALYPQNPLFSLKEIITFLNAHPEIPKINAHIAQKLI